jgi:hypothetical protein
MSRFTRRGFEPVLTGDFEGRFDRFGTGKDGTEVRVEGMVLMARPLSWHEKAQKDDQVRARGAVAIKQQAIASGAALQEVRPSAFADSMHPSARKISGVKRTMEQIPVPEASSDHGK